MPLSFAQAYREFASQNQTARVAAARRLLAEAGEPGSVASVIAHSETDGFRPGVMAALSIPPEYARAAGQYLAAWHGMVTQQPAVVAFHVGEGPDRLHTIRASLQPHDLAETLKSAGIHRFTLRTQPTHTAAHIYDSGGTRDFTRLAQGLPNGSSDFTPGTGFRLGQGADSNNGQSGSNPNAAYRDTIRAAESAAPTPANGGGATRVKLAKLPPGAMRAAEFKPWAAAVAKAPDDRVTRGALADKLEEDGTHHSEATLHLLRTHEGPVFLTRHPVSKKAVAVRGTPVVTGDDLVEMRARAGYAPGPHVLGLGRVTKIFHGPAGISVVRPAYSDPRLHVVDYYDTDGRTVIPSFGRRSSVFHVQPEYAYPDAIRHAFGTTDEQPLRLAKLPAGAIRHTDFRTWANVLRSMPEDSVKRGVLADWLEETGRHHSDADLHRLRSHVGPMFIARHPVSKKVVAIPGHPITDDGSFMHLIQPEGGVAPFGGETVEYHHGPNGIARIRPSLLRNTGYVVEHYSPEGARQPIVDRFGYPTQTGLLYHPDLAGARAVAQRHAYGDTDASN